MLKANKKAIIICPYDFYGNSACSNRIRAFCSVLNQNNISVTIFTLSQEAKEKANSTNDLLEVKVIKNDKVMAQGFLKRFVNELILSFKLICNSGKEHCDIQIVSSPFMGLIIATLFSKHLRKTHLDIRDLVWNYLPSNSFTDKLKKNLISFIIINSLKAYSSISCTNVCEKVYLEKKLSKKSNKINIFQVSNGIDRKRFESLSSLKYKNKSSEKKIVTYIGNVGLAQRLDSFIATADLLPNYDFYVVGDGNDLERIRNLSTNALHDNFFMKGSMNFSEILDIYEKSDILFAQLSIEFSSAIPSKLYEYLSTGKPIVYGGIGSAKDLLSKFDNNIVCSPCEPREICSSIEKINCGDFQISKSNIKQIHNNYIREDCCKKLLDLF